MAQSNNFPRKYRSLFVGIGPRSFNTDPGTIITAYTDESPSMDHLETTVEVEDNYNKIGLQIGYKWGRYSGISNAVLFDISFGENQGGLVSYSFGYNFPMELGDGIFIFRPAFFAGFGNFGFDIGEIQNNAGYIEINGIQYYDSSLKVELSSQVVVYGPEVDFMWMFGGNFDAFLNVNYDLSGNNSRPEVKFSSTSTGDDVSTGTSIDIDNANLDISYNGEALTTLPYKISGLRLTLGLSYVWNRD